MPLINLLQNFYYIFRRRYLIIKKKPDSENVPPPKFMILNVDFGLKLSNFTTWKGFMCLK